VNIPEHIRWLEQRLIEPADRDALDELLHPDCTEVGRSGNTYTRAQLIERLPAENTSRTITIADFHAAEIAPGVALATFTTRDAGRDAANPRRARRVCVWVFQDDRWQLRHHHGTPV
jgi:hypothetical protein